MLREEYEKETGNKCPEGVFSSLDYYHYEIRYSRWLESKLTAQNTIHNSEYKSPSAQSCRECTYDGMQDDLMCPCEYCSRACHDNYTTA